METSVYSVLKKKRKEAGLSVKEVVLLLQKKGISVSDKTVYSWESGYRQPDVRLYIITPLLARQLDLFPFQKSTYHAG